MLPDIVSGDYKTWYYINITVFIRNVGLCALCKWCIIQTNNLNNTYRMFSNLIRTQI